jgi:hypothetical protein
LDVEGEEVLVGLNRIDVLASKESGDVDQGLSELGDPVFCGAGADEG